MANLSAWSLNLVTLTLTSGRGEMFRVDYALNQPLGLLSCFAFVTVLMIWWGLTLFFLFESATVDKAAVLLTLLQD